MKLIKINQDHYIVVDGDSEIKEGDYKYCFMDDVNKIHKQNGQYYDTNEFKITHSTKPLRGGYEFYYGSEGKINLQEVKSLVGEVDVTEKANIQFDKDTEIIPYPTPFWFESQDAQFHSYIKGYNQALKDNKEKKYTEEDLRNAHESGLGYRNGAGQRNLPQEERDREFSHFLQSLQPKTEWNVEFIDGKLKLK